MEQQNFIYRFLSLDNDYVIKTLNNYCITFVNPFYFNDYFDSKPLIYAEGSDEQWLELIMYNGVLHKDILRFKQENNLYTKSELEALLINNRKNYHLIYSQHIKICSLSKSPFDNIMWGHYTNNHKGICLIIKVYYEDNKDYIQFVHSNNKIYKHPIHKVNYSLNKSREINLLINDIENHVYLEKHEKWGYENEYRLLLQNAQNYPFNIREHFSNIKLYENGIYGIILGQNISDKDRENIYKIVNKYNLKCFQAKPNYSNLRIESYEIFPPKEKKGQLSPEFP